MMNENQKKAENHHFCENQNRGDNHGPGKKHDACGVQAAAYEATQSIPSARTKRAGIATALARTMTEKPWNPPVKSTNKSRQTRFNSRPRR